MLFIPGLLLIVEIEPKKIMAILKPMNNKSVYFSLKDYK